MFTEGLEGEGLVGEILSEGDLSAEEIKGELWKKNVSFVKSYDRYCEEDASLPLFDTTVIHAEVALNYALW